MLEVTPGHGPGQPLIAFNLAGGGTACPEPGTGLVALGGDYSRECWNVPSVIDGGEYSDGWWRAGRQLMAVTMARSDAIDDDPEALVFEMYRELIARVRSAGFPELLRIWNYIPGINHGRGDAERYRRFCLGRGRALSEAGLDDAEMCAATAIGSNDDRFRVFALAGRYPGYSFENPRQVSAWRYPSVYGPRSPAFARATAVTLEGGQAGLLISGTASVVGHATAHAGDVRAQTAEAAANIEALLEEAAAQLNRAELARFGSASLARVYIRHAGDWPVVAQYLRRRWPVVKLAGLRGDICRRDLLVEIEAWHCTEP